jgi:hypothetical protein
VSTFFAFRQQLFFFSALLSLDFGSNSHGHKPENNEAFEEQAHSTVNFRT